MGRRSFALLFASTLALVAAPAVSAATLSVDDDGVQCPGAGYAKIQKAVDAANPGDTIAICPGVYVEGSGGVGTNALTISNKSLTIQGAGADLVAIQPKRSTSTGGQIADTNTTPALNIRNGVGDIVSVVGTRGFPSTVNISGVTLDGNGVYVEAGIVYRDAGGTLSRDRVTNIVTSESNNADSIPGGYRSSFPGVGVAQVTAGATGTVARPPLVIDHSRISRYNRYGVLIDSATNDTPPLTAATATSTATLIGDQIVGRTQCTAFNTPTPPPYVLGGPSATPAIQLPGNCSAVGPTTIGPTFGQDGVRVTAGSAVSITDATISANEVHGTGAPTYGSTTNNANLPLGAGVRLIGAGASSITASNLTDNAYGAYNVGLDGAAANTAAPLAAENNFWGLRVNATANVGPAVSPVTNPSYQENPVNGTATADATCTSSAGAAVPNSDAVDFCPFRNGNQADPNSGELPVAYAPLPVSDAGPKIDLTADDTTPNRGDDVKLTAAATDDFGIAKVTFYDGADRIGVAIPPATSKTLTIPADAPCTARTFRAVAEDSTGQTASDDVTVNVTGPNNCVPEYEPTPPAQAPAPSAPSVKLTGVPAEIDEGGATVGADPTIDPALTVGEVKFKLGNRTVCTDSSAPYRCEILPTGAEVGSQSVQAILVDSAAQSASDSADTTVSKFQTKELSIDIHGKRVRGGRGHKGGKVHGGGKPRIGGGKHHHHHGKARYVRKISGAISFDDRVSKADGCATGSVTLTVTENGSSLFPLTQLPLRPDCTYALKFKVPKTKKHNFEVDASFGGNSILRPISNNRRFK